MGGTNREKTRRRALVSLRNYSTAVKLGNGYWQQLLVNASGCTSSACRQRYRDRVSRAQQQSVGGLI